MAKVCKTVIRFVRIFLLQSLFTVLHTCVSIMLKCFRTHFRTEPISDQLCSNTQTRERNGSVVECLTRDRGATGLSLTGVTALWSLSKTYYPSLVLVQPRKTCPCLTVRLLMGRKESYQTK